MGCGETRIFSNIRLQVTGDRLYVVERTNAWGHLMGILDSFLSPAYYPFSLSVTLMAGLLLLEVALMTVGLSTLFDGFDVDTDVEPGILSVFGIDKVPLAVWLIALFGSFAMIGVFVQQVSQSIIGTTLPLWLIVPPAAVASLLSTRYVSIIVAKVMPSGETTAISERQFIGLTGVIATGNARPDLPAQARVTDHFNQSHLIRVVPSEGVLPQGTRIVVVQGPGPIYQVKALDADL